MNESNGTRVIDSPVGPILLVANESGLTHVLFANEEGKPRPFHGDPAGDESSAARRVLDQAEKQLGEYFAGRRREFDLPLAPEGTEFQQAVWNGLREIPFGKTRSYGELADHVGRPKAVRAVGAANGANPISIIVPCHRVIGSDRSLTGFGGGLPAKRTLLELEGLTLIGDRVDASPGRTLFG